MFCCCCGCPSLPIGWTVSRPEKALSIHHYYTTIFTIFRNGQKSPKKAKTPKSIPAAAVQHGKKLSWIINITLILYQHCLQRDTRLVTKSGAGKRGWLFWKLLFVHLSFRARNQNQKMLKYFCGVLSSQGSLSAT